MSLVGGKARTKITFSRFLVNSRFPGLKENHHAQTPFGHLDLAHKHLNLADGIGEVVTRHYYWQS